MKRQKTDWICLKCDRPLRNDPNLKPNPEDSVTPIIDGPRVLFRHDGCDGKVIPGKST